MIRKSIVATSLLCLSLSIGSFATGSEPTKDSRPSGQPEMKLPPGWTPQDMQACMEAGAPGKMHAFLTTAAGSWEGKQLMWMGPDTEPMKSDCTATFAPMMDGRFIKAEVAGNMPGGMGPFNGFGIYGYDNVSKKFQSTWIDNMGTGMMTGTGDLSPDEKVLTWNLTYHCPITKKPTPMREVETITGPNTRTLEAWTIDPKSGKEYQMMKIEFTKK